MSTSWAYHGGGIKSKIRQRDGKQIYYVQVWHEGQRRRATTLAVTHDETVTCAGIRLSHLEG